MSLSLGIPYQYQLGADICSFITLINELRRGTPTMQQSLALVLSVVNYDMHPKSLPQAAAYLLDTLNPTVRLF